MNLRIAIALIGRGLCSGSRSCSWRKLRGDGPDYLGKDADFGQRVSARRGEVTQKQYEAITSSNPSVYKGVDRPVENVSWWDAIRYCNLRSAAKVCRGAMTCPRENAIPRARAIGYRRKRSGSGPSEEKPGEGDARSFHLGVANTKSIDVLKRAVAKGHSRPCGLRIQTASVCMICAAMFGSGAAITSTR